MWYFAKTINSFVPFPCLSILWVESLLQCAVFTVLQSILWNHFGRLQIGRPFSPPQLYFVVWSSERTCQVHHITLDLQASLHFMNSPVFIRWWHLALIALMRWWYQSRDISSFSTFHLPSFHPHLTSSPSISHLSIPIFYLHLPSSIFTFHLHLPPSPFQPLVWRLTQFHEWRSLQTPFQWFTVIQLSASTSCLGSAHSYQSGKLITRRRETTEESSMWLEGDGEQRVGWE